LLDATRFDIAAQLLQNSTASMTQIAATLDYANSSAFTRAFRRWSGRSPTEWRDEHSVARPIADGSLATVALKRGVMRRDTRSPGIRSGAGNRRRSSA
jgi:AraC-like DNA-binding protein